jgi:hypothetical protein
MKNHNFFRERKRENEEEFESIHSQLQTITFSENSSRESSAVKKTNSGIKSSCNSSYHPVGLVLLCQYTFFPQWDTISQETIDISCISNTVYSCINIANIAVFSYYSCIPIVHYSFIHVKLVEQ